MKKKVSNILKLFLIFCIMINIIPLSVMAAISTPININYLTTESTITVTWDSVTDATGYDIEVDGVVIDNGTSTTYEHTDLESATDHTYRVRAKNDTETSEWSTQITVTTESATALDIPTNIVSEATETTIIITWDSVIDATGYDIEVDGVVVDNGTSTTYEHTGLEPATDHAYRVRAKNDTETSDWSSQLTVTTESATVIDIPTNIVNEATENKVTINWDSVLDATGYEIEVDGVMLDNGISTTYEHTGLEPTTDHTYKVRAKNDTETSDWSSQLTVTTESATVIDIPTNILSEATENKVTINWDSVIDATGYEIEVDGVMLDNGISTTYEHTGLEPTTDHTYRVRAKNDTETSDWSTQLTVTTESTTVIDIPTNVVSEATETTITITWDSVLEATGYDIEVDGVIIDSGINTSYEHTGLEAAIDHTYKVRAKNDTETSDWSTQLTVTTESATALDIPTNILSEATENKVTINWDSVIDATGYDIEVDGVIIDNGINTSYEHTGLEAAIDHTYKVRAKNDTETSEWSTQITVTTESATVIGIPTNIVSEATETTITITWDSVLDATDYDIEVDGVVVDNGTSTSYEHTGLESGTEHTYRVRAKNDTETSEWSTQITVTTESATALDIPTNIVSEATETTITITWDSVIDATGYDIEVDGVVVDNGTSTSYEHTGLESATDHTYKVRAKNDTETSEWSTQLTVTTLIVLEIPTNIVSEATENKVTLTWDSVTDVTGYDIEVDGVIIDNGTSITYEHTGLEVATEHSYRVRAKKDSKTSEWSEVIYCTTLSLNKGTGTLEDPYLIYTIEDLIDINNDLTAHYKLMNDIDLANEEWESIGNIDVPFIGTIDGNGYKISNLKIDKPTTDYIGLFGVIENAEIRDLELNNVNIVGKMKTGGLIGQANGISIVDGCSITGESTVSGYHYVGGLIGYVAYGEVNTCSSEAIVIGKNFVGGLIGQIWLRENIDSIAVKGCYALGNIIGEDYVGGLVGRINNTGNKNNVLIDKSYAIGNVNGNTNVGGLIGHIYNLFANISISTSYSTGKVTGTSRVGGIAGYGMTIDIINSYSLSDIAGSLKVGGIIGELQKGNITNCYNTGEIESNSDVGGIVGKIAYESNINNSYYDGVVTETAPTKAEDVSRLTTVMKMESNYEGWDFELVWDIDEGNSYPYLKSLPIPSKITEGLPTEEVAGGTGTIDNPYLISTKEQLENVKYDPESHYKLLNDIDLANEEWTPIGNNGVTFTGTFDGNGHKINNLKIDKLTTDNIGLFGVIEDAEIRNIELNNVDIVGDIYTGGLIGQAKGTSIIDGCAVTGTATVCGYYNVGGLIGNIDSGEITNCYTEVEAISTYKNYGYTGGLVGQISDSVTISNSYVVGNVTSQSIYVGGLIGYILVKGNSVIENCYTLGDVTGGEYVGGLIGYTIHENETYRIDVKNCYSTGHVTGDSNTGGLIGCGDRIDIQDSYSLSKIEGTSHTGGLAGYLTLSNIENSYYSGTITITGLNVGGLVGYQKSSSVVNSYYDGIVAGIVSTKEEDVSRLTTAMKMKSNYEGWNFELVWDIDEGNSYPYLRNLPIPSKVTEGLPTGEVAGGTGTLEDPYLISTKEQLENVKYELKAHYKLMNDIDLLNEEWESIGNIDVPFIGTIDGNGYKISNLKIDKPTTDYIGLFGVIENAEIRDLELNNVNIVGKMKTGGLIGQANGISIVDGCSITGESTVSGYHYVGGLIGNIAYGEVNTCSSEAIVTGKDFVGGLIGQIWLRDNIDSLAVKGCYSKGNVIGEDYVGGLVGRIINNDRKSNVTIDKSYALGNVNGNTKVGGLVGYIYNIFAYITISTSYSTGKVTGISQVGGIAGYGMTIDIINSYSLSDIAGSLKVGGIIGETRKANITNCYNTGEIESNSDVGGIIGLVNDCNVINSYFNSTTTGINTPTEQARTTTELMSGETFIDWDFTYIWGIDEGMSYPYIKYVPVPLQFNQIDILHNKITLSWNEVINATGYEIEIDGVIYDIGNCTEYIHSNLTPGTKYEYRIRALEGDKISKWSTKISVITFLEISVNINISPSDTSINISWDEVSNATKYEIEIDGQEIHELIDTNYTHDNLSPNTQHFYRIRAKNDITHSKWTDIYSVINWNDEPSVCIVANNWVINTDTDNEMDISLKANELTDVYTVNLEMIYDPLCLTINESSISNLLSIEEENSYTSFNIDQETGLIKTIVSFVGENQGNDGQFDILNLKFNLNTDNTTQLNIPFIEMVDSNGNILEITDVIELNIKKISNQ